jgi:hypothetical protein
VGGCDDLAAATLRAFMLEVIDQVDDITVRTDSGREVCVAEAHDAVGVDDVAGVVTVDGVH